ncbi:putative nuclear pore complex protein [Sesbania bispinosa]|nr:putative nuclear pore complex protein [Sesbania bispinosa]
MVSVVKVHKSDEEQQQNSPVANTPQHVRITTVADVTIRKPTFARHGPTFSRVADY